MSIVIFMHCAKKHRCYEHDCLSLSRRWNSWFVPFMSYQLWCIDPKLQPRGRGVCQAHYCVVFCVYMYSARSRGIILRYERGLVGGRIVYYIRLNCSDFFSLSSYSRSRTLFNLYGGAVFLPISSLCFDLAS